jgi:hypothetical protein
MHCPGCQGRSPHAYGGAVIKLRLTLKQVALASGRAEEHLSESRRDWPKRGSGKNASRRPIAEKSGEFASRSRANGQPARGRFDRDHKNYARFSHQSAGGPQRGEKAGASTSDFQGNRPVSQSQTMMQGRPQTHPNRWRFRRNQQGTD